jgi:chloramphenicol 3-O-phosphotransferase
MEDFMEKGKIIFLNGVSSSGKTTLAKKLQERLIEPFYWVNVDTFINMSHEKYFSDRQIVHKAVSVLPHTIKNFSDMGLNTIVDHVLLKIDTLLEECVEILHEYPVVFVHVTCPLEENLHRAKERGSSAEVIEWQLSNLVPQEPYDLTIDTTNDDCIDKIIQLIDYPKKFTAFKTLWSQRTK